VQAQDRRAAALALRARAPGVSAETVEHALSGHRTLVRTWAMRGTLHLLGAEDLPLALAVFGPVQLRRAQRRLAELGLPPAVAERGTEEAAAVLAEEGPLTRDELAERLRARGVPVAAEGQAPIHMVARAALAGVLCEVGVRRLEPLYGHIDPGPLPDRDEALAELAVRYERAHAPAGIDDFAAWSGLPAADVRRAWEALINDSIEGGGGGAPAAALPPSASYPGQSGLGGHIGHLDRTAPRILAANAEPTDPASLNAPLDDRPAAKLRLLPAFDEWLLGWASRDFTLPREHARKVAPGGGIIRPVVIADGHVVATWRLDRPRGRVEIAPFARIDPTALEQEAAVLAAFLGTDLELAL
jgi:Winged helix DNA-binding domain